MNDQAAYDLARRTLTAREFDAWKLEAAGLSQWSIATALGVSRWAIRDRLRSAHEKLERARREHAA